MDNAPLSQYVSLKVIETQAYSIGARSLQIRLSIAHLLRQSKVFQAIIWQFIVTSRKKINLKGP